MHRKKRILDRISVGLLLSGFLMLFLSLGSGVIAQTDNRRITELEKENIGSADKIAVLQKAIDSYERLQLDNRLTRMETQNDFILKIGYGTIGTLLFLLAERLWQVVIGPRKGREKDEQ